MKRLYHLSDGFNPIWFSISATNPLKRFYGANHTMTQEKREARILELAKDIRKEAQRKLGALDKLIEEAEA